MPIGKNICACGCGGKCNGRFIRGHHLIGRSAWNKGLTKETDERVAKIYSKDRNQKIRTSKLGKLRPPFSVETKHNMSMARTGKFHSVRTKLSMSISHKETYALHGDEILEKRMLYSGWHKFPYVFPDGTIRKMRSNWEVVYAKYLDSLNIKWQYEPRGFKLSNGKRYFPDFYLPEKDEWHEIKGFMSKIAQEKINLFTKDYPNEKLVIVRDITTICQLTNRN